jgi:hypothetical protein
MGAGATGTFSECGTLIEWMRRLLSPGPSVSPNAMVHPIPLETRHPTAPGPRCV